MGVQVSSLTCKFAADANEALGEKTVRVEVSTPGQVLILHARWIAT